MQETFAGSVFDICVLEKGFHENVPLTAYCGNTSTPEKHLNGVEAYILCGWPNKFHALGCHASGKVVRSGMSVKSTQRYSE